MTQLSQAIARLEAWNVGDTDVVPADYHESHDCQTDLRLVLAAVRVLAEATPATDEEIERAGRFLSRIAELEAALQGMLDHFDRPARSEWLNDSAYESAVLACANARKVLTP